MNASHSREKVDGQWEDVTTWVTCSMFGQRGEKLAPHLTKRSSVTVVGALTTHAYEAKDGSLRVDVKCAVDQIALQGGGGEREPEPQRREAPRRQAEPQRTREVIRPEPARRPPPREPSPASWDDDDSTPFD